MKRRVVDGAGVTVKLRGELETKISPREIDCLDLLSKGYSVKQIANALNISHRTSGNHVYNVKEKTGYNLRSDLVSLYLDQIKSKNKIYFTKC